jgi:hypothetical protein
MRLPTALSPMYVRMYVCTYNFQPESLIDNRPTLPSVKAGSDDSKSEFARNDEKSTFYLLYLRSYYNI